MANPERPGELDPDRNPEYTVNPTFNNPIYPAEPRATSRSVGGLAAAAIIAVVAFLALAFFGGGSDQQANAPADQPAMEGTENPPTGSITRDPTMTTPVPQSDTAPQAAPEAPATDTPAPAQPAPAQ